VKLDAGRPLVYFITDGSCGPENHKEASDLLLERIATAVEAGVDLVQIREKRLTGRQLFELTQRSAEIVRGSRTRLLVNDRFDIALAAGADGVHLTSTSLPAAVVRSRTPENFVIGVSVHSEEEARSAAAASADFVLFGPVFASPGKGDGVGTDALERVCRSVPDTPVLAVGGLRAQNFRAVLDSGAAGFAAIRALNDPASLHQIMDKLGR